MALENNGMNYNFETLVQKTSYGFGRENDSFYRKAVSTAYKELTNQGLKLYGSYVK